MLRWFRRWPAYALNGLSVSVGIGLVQLLVSAFATAAFAQAATVGAVLASLPHLTGRAVPMWRRSLLGGLLAALVALPVLLLTEHPVLRGVLIALVVFTALLAMAWGKRAASLVFSVIIGVIFSLARPSSHAALATTAASACGVVLYSCWAFLNAKLLEARYRTLAVFRTLEAASALLLARAAVLSHADAGAEDDATARFAQLSEESALAEALQVARDLVFLAPRHASGTQIALISSIAELREIMLTSRLDLDLLGHDHAARFVRARLALGLKRLGLALDELARRRFEAAASTPELSPVELPDMMQASPLLESDPRARLLPAIAARLRYLGEEVEHVRRLLQGVSERSSMPPEELTSFISDDDTWPLSAVREHLSLSSPVLRHAVRSALAMLSVYFLAYALPWTTRPYWMLLSVAVVLRGTLDDTLSRRNARVLGTAIGCVLVTVLVPLLPTLWLKLVFAVAVGVAHAFVNVRYRLTAIAATVMALLQAQLAAPNFTPLVLERLLDTVLGGLFAWAFSYVLPSWERRGLPVALERALGALRAYSDSALRLDTSARPRQRIDRQHAYDALAVISAAVQRSAAEPKRVQPPVKPLVSALDHAQQLMAHLSSLRSLLYRRARRLSLAEVDLALASARQTIDAQLTLQPVGFAAEPSDLLLAELPGTSVDESPLPWLLRRLEAAQHDAQATGRAAREAMSQLARSRA